jgi:putative oxidoreductase
MNGVPDGALHAPGALTLRSPARSARALLKDATMTLTAAIWLIARLCLVAMFPFSALDKVWHRKNSLAQTDSAGLPGGRAMLVMAIVVEGLTPFFIVAGIWDRPAAVLLAGFCLVTAFLYHPFWRGPDFFSPRDDSVAREHFWQFLKNFGLIGGLLLVVFAGSLAPLGAAVRPANWSSLHQAAAPARGG